MQSRAVLAVPAHSALHSEPRTNLNSPQYTTVTMGRELQKKKNKSSVPRKRQNGPSKKKILSNPIIAKHWYVGSSLSASSLD
jgi:hypothetical protein